MVNLSFNNTLNALLLLFVLFIYLGKSLFLDISLFYDPNWRIEKAMPLNFVNNRIACLYPLIFKLTQLNFIFFLIGFILPWVSIFYDPYYFNVGPFWHLWFTFFQLGIVIIFLHNKLLQLYILYIENIFLFERFLEIVQVLIELIIVLFLVYYLPLTSFNFPILPLPFTSVFQNYFLGFNSWDSELFWKIFRLQVVLSIYEFDLNTLLLDSESKTLDSSKIIDLYNKTFNKNN